MRLEKSTMMVLNLRFCSAQTIQKELECSQNNLVVLDCSQNLEGRLECSKNLEKAGNGPTLASHLVVR